MNEEIRMAGERTIDKETKRLKIDNSMIDILLPMMLENIEKNASELDEEEFYLLDCLVKCKLLLVNIDIDEDYSINVKHLLEYCKQEHSEMQTFTYTYVALTYNNVDSLINWMLKKGMKSNKLSYKEEETVKSLLKLKESFCNPFEKEECLKCFQEIENVKIALNIGVDS